MIRMRIVPVRLSLINVSLSNLKNDDKKNKIDGINLSELSRFSVLMLSAVCKGLSVINFFL